MKYLPTSKNSANIAASCEVLAIGTKTHRGDSTVVNKVVDIK